MSVAVLPGSYDPMTLGHLDLVHRALALYDRVVVAVMNNEQKMYRFDMDERVHIAALTLAGLDRVTLTHSAGLLVDLFDAVGGTVIVKGVRDERDRAYEEEMAAWNIAHNPRAKTVLLQAEDAYRGVCSTAVRDLLAKKKEPVGLVAPAVLAYFKECGFC